MKIRIIASALAAFFVLPLLCGTAFAVELDDLEDIVITEDQPAPEETTIPTDAPVTDYPETPPRPFTPAGTGTVIDNATDSDGKEFYTIITPDENVFYLVIDRQRETENVYFLNAVTETDLLALAKMPERTVPDPAPTVTESTPAPAAPEQTPSPAPEPEQGGGNTGMIILIAAVVLVGGGAGYYFKIYRPKQQRADAEEDYDYSADEGDPYGEDDSAEDDGLPPWDEDNEPDGDEAE